MNRQRVARELVSVAKMLTAAEYIDADTLTRRIPKNIAEAERIASREMRKAKFALVGADSEFIYFNVVARLTDVTENEIRDIKEKTRFEPLSESRHPIYVGKFRMRIM